MPWFHTSEKSLPFYSGDTVHGRTATATSWLFSYRLGPIWNCSIFAILKQYYGIWWYCSIGAQKVFGLYSQNLVLNTMVYPKCVIFWVFETPPRTSYFFFSLYIYFVFPIEPNRSRFWAILWFYCGKIIP